MEQKNNIQTKLTVNALRVLRARYLRKNEKGEIIETPDEMFRRVAKAIVAPEKKFSKIADTKKLTKDFYEMMAKLEFLPNTPTLMNAGTEISQLSACFVLPIEDSLASIMDAARDASLIHQTGGGVGFSFSNLRPKGDIVKSTGGAASGPVSFAEIFDKTTEVVRQGGRRRGANMGILSVYHPDILDFVNAKQESGRLKNFNLSVAVDDNFMQAVEKDLDYNLVNPRTKKVVKKISAKSIFDAIIFNAWKTGDPGLIFLDEINRKNFLISLGKIEATNPCGEQPLFPYESCNLGSINLVKFVENGKINYNKLKITVRQAVHFLDNVIEANKFPLKEIEKQTLVNRRIGLGIMGFAQMLILLGVSYNSEKAFSLAEKIMKFINDEAHEKSEELGKIRGSFPNFKKSNLVKRFKAMRNVACTTIAPTGTISIITGCSSGIEPLFALVYIRKVLDGAKLLEVDPLFEKWLKENNLYSQEFLSEIARFGSIQKIPKIPKSARRLFVTTYDIDPLEHVKMQASFQKFTDNAVSKTINLPHEAGTRKVAQAFWQAWKLKCKGITIYRYGSKKEQVLNLGKGLFRQAQEEFTSAREDYAGGCEASVCPF